MFGELTNKIIGGSTSDTSDYRRLNLRRLLGLYCFAFGLIWFGTPILLVQAAGATLGITPASGEFAVGENVKAIVRLHAGGNPVNAAEASLNFSPEVLHVISISKTESIFAFWPVEPSIDSEKGIVQFAGGTPTAFSGSSGIVLTITFSVKKTGEGMLNFSGGRILLADGSGTDVFAGSQGANWKLVAVKVSKEVIGAPSSPVIHSSTHPDLGRWYSNNNPRFFWELPREVTGVSVAFDSHPLTDPGPLSDGLIREKTFEKIVDGEWYFHIKFRNKGGWGAITHRKVLIDTEPPEAFSVMLAEGKETANPQPVALFSTIDTLSGLSHYELKIGDGDFFGAPVERQHNPYRLPIQAPGKRTLLVIAYDKAGNSTVAPEEEFTILPPLRSPAIPLFLKIILAVLLMLSAVLGYTLYRAFRFKKSVHKEVGN